MAKAAGCTKTNTTCACNCNHYTCPCNCDQKASVCGVNTNGTANSCVCNVDASAKCPSHQTAWTSIAEGVEITDAHIKEIRVALDAEYNRRNYVRQQHKFTSGSGYNTDCDAITVNSGTYTQTINPGITIEDIDAEELYRQINAIKSETWNTNVSSPLADVLITSDQIEELRDKINTREVECLCDCDYCTCNCNYYACPCNCNNCVCMCDYCCTCNCNQLLGVTCPTNTFPTTKYPNNKPNIPGFNHWVPMPPPVGMLRNVHCNSVSHDGIVNYPWKYNT